MSPQAPVPKAPRLSLAWLITGILALQLAAWLGWFVLAAHHPVAEVPLATAGR